MTLMLGLSTVPVSLSDANHGDVAVMIALADWVQSVATFHASPELLCAVPTVFKIYLFFGMTVFIQWERLDEGTAEERACFGIPSAADFTAMARAKGSETRPADRVRLSAVELPPIGRAAAWLRGSEAWSTYV